MVLIGLGVELIGAKIGKTQQLISEHKKKKKKVENQSYLLLLENCWSDIDEVLFKQAKNVTMFNISCKSG